MITASMALTWILFLALFPMAFIWMRRAWRILAKRNYSEVALKRGESPPNPAKWAPFAAVINLAAGFSAIFTIFGVLVLGMAYEDWSAIAGVTIWMKVFADFILSRQAHPFVIKKGSWLGKRLA